MNNWQPIETAPKTGKRILACNADSGSIEIVQWDSIDMTGKKGWQSSSEATSDWNYYQQLYGATHWMELPELP